MTMYALEYGFFNYLHVDRLVLALSKVVKSLNKLEYAWNEKYEKEKAAVGDDLLRVETFKQESENFNDFLPSKYTLKSIDTAKSIDFQESLNETKSSSKPKTLENKSGVGNRKSTESNIQRNLAYF